MLLKLKTFCRPKRLLALAAVLTITILSCTNLVSAQSITQGYNADTQLERGIIVGKVDKDDEKVAALKRDGANAMLGVVVDANDSPVTISGANPRVYVATVGQYDTLVSDQNGPIEKGDYIAISSLSGIGMKADLGDETVLGKALANFNGNSNVLTTAKLKDSDGNSRTVHIARILVDLTVSQNPLSRSHASAPLFLDRIGQAVAGKSVSSSKIYLSAGIFLVGSMISGAVLYAGVRSSIYSIGRNPLSRRSIFKGLIQVILISLIIFAGSLIGVYLLLKI